MSLASDWLSIVQAPTCRLRCGGSFVVKIVSRTKRKGTPRDSDFQRVSESQKKISVVRCATESFQVWYRYRTAELRRTSFEH
jgi:hypothetical protein